MDEAAGCLGAAIALLLVIGALGLGGLLVMSKGVLYSEEQMADTYYGQYRCLYFTGTRTVELMNNSMTGCPRFIEVGR